MSFCVGPDFFANLPETCRVGPAGHLPRLLPKNLNLDIFRVIELFAKFAAGFLPQILRQETCRKHKITQKYSRT